MQHLQMYSASWSAEALNNLFLSISHIMDDEVVMLLWNWNIHSEYEETQLVC